jgi:ectoine hydroxylase-related dioxygenase (phytanoyl-CoA dioxygenase family)
MNTLADYQAQFTQNGFVQIKQMLSPEEVVHYTAKLEALSGFYRQAHNIQNRRSGMGKRGLANSFSQPDGVTKNREFWPLITHKQLLTTVRALLHNEEIRFCRHTDLHVGFSAISWHRDNVNRRFGTGPDWQLLDPPYQVVRVGFYLQTFAESGFRLGFIPGSHRPQAQIDWRRKFQERKLQWIGGLSYLFVKFQEWASNAEWIATEPGDCIIFDPRLLHSGSYITGPKYSLFVAYGVENAHYFNHQNYYRYMRPELKYGDLAPELITLLKDADLYPENPQVYEQVENAWLPPAVMRRVVTQGVK